MIPHDRSPVCPVAPETLVRVRRMHWKTWESISIQPARKWDWAGVTAYEVYVPASDVAAAGAAALERAAQIAWPYDYKPDDEVSPDAFAWATAQYILALRDPAGQSALDAYVAEKVREAVEAVVADCDQFDAPVSASDFVNGQATAAQQIRAALAKLGAPK